MAFSFSSLLSNVAQGALSGASGAATSSISPAIPRPTSAPAPVTVVVQNPGVNSALPSDGFMQRAIAFAKTPTGLVVTAALAVGLGLLARRLIR